MDQWTSLVLAGPVFAERPDYCNLTVTLSGLPWIPLSIISSPHLMQRIHEDILFLRKVTRIATHPRHKRARSRSSPTLSVHSTDTLHLPLGYPGQSACPGCYSAESGQVIQLSNSVGFRMLCCAFSSFFQLPNGHSKIFLVPAPLIEPTIPEYCIPDSSAVSDRTRQGPFEKVGDVDPGRKVEKKEDYGKQSSRTVSIAQNRHGIQPVLFELARDIIVILILLGARPTSKRVGFRSTTCYE
ncbi:hypothetical protein C8J56DRAFT_879860 [Mycena floridula]|nr:hypothetical protein C8J56DRAFT_879860 [Mycena floridula]